jgi:hypothetical protein
MVFLGGDKRIIDDERHTLLTYNDVERIACFATENKSAIRRYNFGTIVFWLTTDKTRALEDLRLAVELQPDSERYQKGFSVACNSTGAWDAVLPLAKKFPRHMFKDSELQKLLALASERTEDQDAAILYKEGLPITNLS